MTQPIKHKEINGLSLFENFISEEEEFLLIENIDTKPELWLSDLKRRVQHFGYKYDYTKKLSSKENSLGPLPVWLQDFSQKLVSQKLIKQPEQVIVNEYLTGQGIGLHVDRITSFGPVVISLSLLTDCNMKFVNQTSFPKKEELVLLPRRSLVVLEKDARYVWAHGIPPLKSERRVSITFRTMNKD